MTAILANAINNAASDLPVGWLIELCVERGAGWVELYNPDGDRHELEELADSTLGEQVMAAINEALRASGAARAAPETSARTWLIRKGGYYYRPDRAGYTSSIADAGRYTEAEAKAEAAIEPAIMQAVPTKECSYCHGEGTVSLSTGDRMLCSLCGGGGVTVSEEVGNV